MLLETFIGKMANAENVSVEEEGILIGGAIQENRGIKVIIDGGIYSGRHQMVLRGESEGTIPDSNPLEQQFKILKILEAEGIKAPIPYWYCDDTNITGKRFFLMKRVKGEALGNRITRHGEQLELAAALGRELARIHKISPHQHDLGFLNSISISPSADAIIKYRNYLDDLPEPHPVLEWTLRWLEMRSLESEEIVLCHRDFRTGNYMVKNSSLVSILDWEFSGWGDRHEDIAWFCARCWRFSCPTLHAGGIAPRSVFYEAYEREANKPINRDLVYYWETMAHVRWAVIALQQTMRHRSGQKESLELALIGRRLAELEYECLRLTGVLKE